jgi:hypothetical protein
LYFGVIVFIDRTFGGLVVKKPGLPGPTRWYLCRQKHLWCHWRNLNLVQYARLNSNNWNSNKAGKIGFYGGGAWYDDVMVTQL